VVTFLLIRHGHCPHVGNYLAGRSPGIRLDDEGIREVRSLAGRIRRIHLDEIVSSPLERSVETASVIAEGRGLEIKISDAVNEVDCGEWTGKSFRELEKDPVWISFNRYRSVTRIPGGEMIVEVLSRMSRFMEEKRREGKEVVAIVSHGDPIRAVITHYLGLPVDFKTRFEIHTSSVSVITLDDYGASLKCLNHTGTLNEKGLV
jgi:broad specificity phosphatase PhoE